MLDLLSLLNLLLAALVSGALSVVQFGMIPYRKKLDGAGFTGLHQTLNAFMDRYMRRITGAALVSGIALTGLRWASAPDAAKLGALGVAGLAGVTVTTLMFNVPINRTVDTWSKGSAPANFAAVRDRWDRFHALRTFTSFVAFAAFAAALLVGSR